MSDDVPGDEGEPSRGRVSSRRGQTSIADPGATFTTTRKVSALLADNINVSAINDVPADEVQDIELIERRDRLPENSWRRLAISFLLAAFVLLNAAV